MKFKSTEPAQIKHATDAQTYIVEPGDEVTLPDAIGEYFCDQGWGYNVETEDAPRVERNVTRRTVLDPQSAVMAVGTQLK